MSVMLMFMIVITINTIKMTNNYSAAFFVRRVFSLHLIYTHSYAKLMLKHYSPYKLLAFYVWLNVPLMQRNATKRWCKHLPVGTTEWRESRVRDEFLFTPVRLFVSQVLPEVYSVLHTGICRYIQVYIHIQVYISVYKSTRKAIF